MKCHLTILNEVSALIQIASSIKKLTIRCYPLWVASLCILCSCSFRSDEYKLQYKVAHGYFVKNDIPCSQIPPCIDSKEKFDDLFGMAAVMGEMAYLQPSTFRARWYYLWYFNRRIPLPIF